jgi:hypothetical protein
VWRDTLEGKFERLAEGLGIKRGLTRPGLYEVSTASGSRLSAPLSPAQSLPPKISFKTTDAAVGEAIKVGEALQGKAGEAL